MSVVFHLVSQTRALLQLDPFLALPFLSVCYFVLQVLGEFIDFSLDLFNCCSNVMNVNVLGHLKHCCYASNR